VIRSQAQLLLCAASRLLMLWVAGSPAPHIIVLVLLFVPEQRCLGRPLSNCRSAQCSGDGRCCCALVLVLPLLLLLLLLQLHVCQSTQLRVSAPCSVG
jgi:hypothetical protein